MKLIISEARRIVKKRKQAKFYSDRKVENGYCIISERKGKEKSREE